MSVLLSLVATAVASSAMPDAAVPDRLFDCELGRVTNLRAATPAELGLVGKHRVIVLQPGAAVELDSLPARPPIAAKLVKIHDPDNIVAGHSFDTVIDVFPKKLDFIAKLPAGQRAFVTFAGFKPGTGSASIAAGLIGADVETVVSSRYYQGECRFEAGFGLAKSFDRLKGVRR